MKRRSASARATTRRAAVLQLAAGAVLAIVPPTSFATVYMSPEEAVALIFPGASFEHREVVLSKEQQQEIQRRCGSKVRMAKLDVWRAQDGAVVLIDRVTGKHELITYACGINPDQSIKQVEILEYREAYGDAIRDARWRAQFTGKRAGAPLALGEDIRNVSGATLSCRHVTEGVRRLLASYEVALK